MFDVDPEGWVRAQDVLNDLNLEGGKGAVQAHLDLLVRPEWVRRWRQVWAGWSQADSTDSMGAQNVQLGLQDGSGVSSNGVNAQV